MTQRDDKGARWFEAVYGEGKAAGLVAMQTGLAQDLARLGVEVNFGDIYSRPGLTLAQRELLSLASLVTIGGLEPQLRGHTRGAINVGCTPTEILDAWDAGADVVKVFPATTLGPGYLKDIHGPLPHVKLMPTGGVTLDNAGDWIRAGAVAVGVGTSLLDTKAIAAGDYAVLRANAERIVGNVKAALAVGGKV